MSKIAPDSVMSYCIDKLGSRPLDKEFGALLIDTPCGQDCKMAIDAAAAWIGTLQTAYDTKRFNHERVQVIELCFDVIQVFYFG